MIMTIMTKTNPMITVTMTMMTVLTMMTMMMAGATTTVPWTPPSCTFTTQAPTTTLVCTTPPPVQAKLLIIIVTTTHTSTFSDQDPDARADKAEDDMWYVLQENDELRVKIEVRCANQTKSSEVFDTNTCLGTHFHLSEQHGSGRSCYPLINVDTQG